MAGNGVGACWAPTMARVANTTIEFAPGRACTRDRRQMLAACRRVMGWRRVCFGLSFL